MRKILLAILTLLYAIACIGFTMRAPYCTSMTECKAVRHSITKKCYKCSNENITTKDNKCCSSEHRFVKDDNDQNIPESVFHSAYPAGVALHTSFFEESFNNFSSITGVNVINHPQPPEGGTLIYVRNCVFRI